MASIIYSLLSNNINSFIYNVSFKYNIPLYSLINDWNTDLDIKKIVDIKFENVCKECDKPLKNNLCWPCYNKHEIEKLEKHEECDKRGHFCEFEDCYYCFTRSFKMCEKSRYWSKKNNTTPRMVSLNANKKHLFDCFNCGHEFSKRLSDVARGKWCPYCCYTTQKLCDKEDCKHCFNNSFASHPRSKYWSSKNIDEEGKFISPRSIIKGSANMKRIFECPCGHSYESLPCSKSYCPYCSKPPRKLCDKEDCKQCFEKSFASNPKSKYWSSKNPDKPRDVFYSSPFDRIFNCESNHEFISSMDELSRSNWCPHCNNKTEGKFRDWYINEGFLFTIVCQYRVDWCKNDRYFLPFDLCIEELKLLIEIDGRQHFEQVLNWESSEIIRGRDKYKMKCALENGYSMIRISQRDIWNDSYDWKTDASKYIRLYETPTIIYLAKDKSIYNVYTDYIEIVFV